MTIYAGSHHGKLAKIITRICNNSDYYFCQVIKVISHDNASRQTNMSRYSDTLIVL